MKLLESQYSQYNRLFTFTSGNDLVAIDFG